MNLFDSVIKTSSCLFVCFNDLFTAINEIQVNQITFEPDVSYRQILVAPRGWI